MPVPNQIPKLNFEGQDPSFSRHYSQLVDAVNSLLGYSGTISLANHVDLGGKRLMNVGAPQAATDALISATAEERYSAPVLKTKLESNGSSPLSTYRQINNSSQRESQSSVFNDLMSSVPNANAIYPSLQNDGSEVLVVVPSSIFTFADGSTVLLEGRTDLLSKPEKFNLTSISVSSGVVTAVFSYTAPVPAIAAGNQITIAGVSGSGFNGSFALTSVVIDTGAKTVTVEMQNATASGAGSGGTLQANGCYYYSARRRSNQIHLVGPFGTDTNSNRIEASRDGSQIVAVVVITASGADVANSGGGGSAITGAPAAGCFF